MSETTFRNQTSQPAGRSRRSESGHVVWNALVVIALLANVALFINSRQIAGAVAQMDLHNQDQIARLTQDLTQNNAATQQSVESLARQSQESATQAAAAAEAESAQGVQLPEQLNRDRTRAR